MPNLNAGIIELFDAMEASRAEYDSGSESISFSTALFVKSRPANNRYSHAGIPRF